MKTHLQTPIGKLEDPDILLTIEDLLEMRKWRKEDFLEHNLREFLEVVFNAPAIAISLAHIAVPRVIDRKMGKLQDHGFYPVCRALKNEACLEQHAGITLLSFLKKHYASLQTYQKPHPPEGRDIVTRTNLQRRDNAR